jgi:mannose-6-phosphate isomerase-like protein (cupin superfamily)
MTSEQKPINAPTGAARFDRPTLVRRSEAIRYLWGDETSQQVPDLFYGRGEYITGFIFKLSPGKYFRASETWRPMYNQDRFYYVVSGELTVQDPESGDVSVAKAGEVIYWQGERYHFGYNFSFEETLVLDWYTPLESKNGSFVEIELSKQKRNLDQNLGERADLFGKWPHVSGTDRTARQQEGRVTAIKRADALSIVYGEKNPVRFDIFASSNNLTAGDFDLRPSTMSDPEMHGGEEVLFVLKESLHVYLPDSFQWFELGPLDCLYIPKGVRHQYANTGAQVAKAAFCIAPAFRP